MKRAKLRRPITYALGNFARYSRAAALAAGAMADSTRELAGEFRHVAWLLRRLR